MEEIDSNRVDNIAAEYRDRLSGLNDSYIRLLSTLIVDDQHQGATIDLLLSAGRKFQGKITDEAELNRFKGSLDYLEHGPTIDDRKEKFRIINPITSIIKTLENYNEPFKIDIGSLREIENLFKYYNNDLKEYISQRNELIKFVDESVDSLSFNERTQLTERIVKIDAEILTKHENNLESLADIYQDDYTDDEIPGLKDFKETVAGFEERVSNMNFSYEDLEDQLDQLYDIYKSKSDSNPDDIVPLIDFYNEFSNQSDESDSGSFAKADIFNKLMNMSDSEIISNQEMIEGLESIADKNDIMLGITANYEEIHEPTSSAVKEYEDMKSLYLNISKELKNDEINLRPLRQSRDEMADDIAKIKKSPIIRAFSKNKLSRLSTQFPDVANKLRTQEKIIADKQGALEKVSIRMNRYYIKHPEIQNKVEKPPYSKYSKQPWKRAVPSQYKEENANESVANDTIFNKLDLAGHNEADFSRDDQKGFLASSAANKENANPNPSVHIPQTFRDSLRKIKTAPANDDVHTSKPEAEIPSEGPSNDNGAPSIKK